MWAYPEIQAFEQQDAEVAYPDNALLFIGSSSIRLWKTLEQDMAPYPVIQRGYHRPLWGNLESFRQHATGYGH